MANRGIKIALPGYNAFTDTDPDHFSLFVDPAVDYVLIKEKTKGVVTVSGSTTIAHGLGYVPMCLVFFLTSAGVWQKVFSRGVDGSSAYFQIDGTNLTLVGTGTFAYHIFFDNITDGTPPELALGPHSALVVARAGYNAETDKNPNHFIFHSDYNTFKIILEGTKTVTLAASTNNQSFTQAHSQRFIPLVHAFAKETAKAQVFLVNSGNVDLYGAKAGIITTGVTFNYVRADATNIIFNFSNTVAATKEVSIRYFCLEKVT